MVDLIVNLIGNTFSAMSWIPQIIKMLKTKDVSGFDVRAYLMSMCASAVFFTYALCRSNWFFMAFAAINFSLCAIETFLIIWYGYTNARDHKPVIEEVTEDALVFLDKHHLMLHSVVKWYYRTHVKHNPRIPSTIRTHIHRRVKACKKHTRRG